MALTSTIIQKHQQDLKPYIQEVLSTPNFKEIEKFIAEAKQDPRNPFNKTPE